MSGELERLRSLLNTPELQDFEKAVHLEACHQRERWGEDHDADKEPQDGFWTLGYLAGKAMRSHMEGNFEKAKHHTITAAALLNNWHSRILADEEASIQTPIFASREALYEALKSRGVEPCEPPKGDL